ncbi:MAG: hypothetical protein K6B17_00035 [Treponema sp.]|nr:hypothetical protein [Treponema sp.]
MKKSAEVFVLLFALISTFAGCSGNKKINLNPHDEEAITPDLQWAVVKVPYAVFRADCDYESEIIRHARSGDIFLVRGSKTVLYVFEDTLLESDIDKEEREIIEESENVNKNKKPVRKDKKSSSHKKRKVEQNIVWYKFDEGWLESSQVEVFDTKLKAEFSSESYKK